MFSERILFVEKWLLISIAFSGLEYVPLQRQSERTIIRKNTKTKKNEEANFKYAGDGLDRNGQRSDTGENAMV